MNDSQQNQFNPAEDTEADRKSLERLYDYTKFHIGVYITLTGTYLTIATAKFQGNTVLNLDLGLVGFAALCFLIAGMAGGVIASSLTQKVGGSSASFLDDRIGPWVLRLWRARTWTHIEHTSFWIGLLVAVYSFLRQSPDSICFRMC